MSRSDARLVVLPIALALAISALLLMFPGVPSIGVLFLPPLIASFRVGVRATALVAVTVVVLALVILTATNRLEGFENITRALTVAIGGATAIVVAWVMTKRRVAERALRESEERLRLALEGTATGSWEWGVATGTLSGSREMLGLVGFAIDHVPASVAEVEQLVFRDDRARVRATIQAALDGRQDFKTEFRVVWPDGSVHWLEARGHASESISGEPRFVGVANDISERKRTEEGLAYLADANAILDSSLDLDSVLQSLAEVAVPFLADACMVDVLEDDRIRRAGSAARDAAVRETMGELQRQILLPLESDHAIAKALRSGEIHVIDSITDETKRGWATSSRHLEILNRFPARALVIAPMKLGDEVLGTISAISTDADQPFGPFEIWLIDELARRAAVVVGNANAYAERAEIAATLQQSLLPPDLPQIPGLDLASSYRAGGRGLEVGGDFYDVFPTAGDSWGVLIGDVSGKGARAAAATSLARYTIRAVALREHSPRRMLELVNRSLLAQFGAQQFCTVACAALQRDAEGMSLSLALGGHPQPIILRRDGKVEAVGEPGSLLGAFDKPVVHEQQLKLRTGDTLVLFTDGLTELRTGEEQRLGERGLEKLLARWHGGTAGDLVTHIETAVASRGLRGDRDDLAVLVVRMDAQAGEQVGMPGDPAVVSPA